jgi:hypothetical protein
VEELLLSPFESDVRLNCPSEVKIVRLVGLEVTGEKIK